MHNYFVDFVCQQAKMRNNLSISLLSSSSGPSPMRKFVYRSPPLYKSMAGRKGALLKKLLFPQAVLRSVGGDLIEKCCSKICTVRISPAGQQEKEVWLYVISLPFIPSFLSEVLSSLTSSTSKFIALFTPSRRVLVSSRQGLNITELPGGIPGWADCNAMPNDHPEIRTAEAGLHYPLHRIQSLTHSLLS